MERLSYTMSEAARAMGISRTQLRRLIARGELPAKSVSGSQRPRFVVSKRALGNWLGSKVPAMAVSK